MARRQANHQTLLPQFISTMAIAILRLPLSLSSINSSCISELKTEEKQLQERLIALEEQRFMVQEMSADANKRRKFDEVAGAGRQCGGFEWGDRRSAENDFRAGF